MLSSSENVAGIASSTVAAAARRAAVAAAFGDARGAYVSP